MTPQKYHRCRVQSVRTVCVCCPAARTIKRRKDKGVRGIVDAWPLKVLDVGKLEQIAQSRQGDSRGSRCRDATARRQRRVDPMLKRFDLSEGTRADDVAGVRVRE